jgi:hypothetical protein
MGPPSKISAMGASIEFESRIAASNVVISGQLSKITELTTSISNSNRLLEEALKKIPETSSSRDAIDSAIKNNQSMIGQSERLQETSQNTINQNSQALQDFNFSKGGKWLVVFGADTSEEAARHELKRAKSASLENVRIYKRDGFFNSAVVFENVSDAQRALVKIRALSEYSRGAYVVPYSSFCRSPIELNAELFDCNIK